MSRCLDFIQNRYGCSLGIFDDLINCWDESIKNKMAAFWDESIENKMAAAAI